MPRPRTPAAKADVSGAAAKNPKRHKAREPASTAKLGKPPAWMKAGGKSAWNAFKRELPWLTEADRSLVEIAASIRGRLIDYEDVGVSAINQLRLCLAQMGATPADRSKVALPKDDDKDPEDKLFD